VLVQFFPEILQICGLNPVSSNLLTTRWIFMIILNVLLYPIVYVKDITALAHFNFLGFASAVYVIFVLGV